MPNPSQNTESSQALNLLIGASMISFSGVYVKIAQVTPTVAGFYRVFLGGIFLLILVLFRQERLWNGFKYFALEICSGLLLALDLFFWHKSIHYVGPGLATILSNFQVILLALVGLVFLSEKMSLKLLMAVPLGLLGLFLIVGFRWGQLEKIYRTGIWLGLATAACYAAYILTLRRLQSCKSPLSAMVNLTVISFVTAAFLGGEAWRLGEAFAIPDKRSLLALVGYGLSSQMLGWMLITTALAVLRASLAGLLLLLQPALAFIWDVLFFNRTTSLTNWAGVLLTLAAIYMGSTSRMDRPALQVHRPPVDHNGRKPTGASVS